MQIEDLRLLKRFIESSDGRLLKDYISNYITSEARKRINANEIAGMCILFEKIKNIPLEVEEANKQRR